MKFWHQGVAWRWNKKSIIFLAMIWIRIQTFPFTVTHRVLPNVVLLSLGVEYAFDPWSFYALTLDSLRTSASGLHKIVHVGYLATGGGRDLSCGRGGRRPAYPHATEKWPLQRRRLLMVLTKQLNWYQSSCCPSRRRWALHVGCDWHDIEWYCEYDSCWQRCLLLAFLLPVIKVSATISRRRGAWDMALEASDCSSREVFGCCLYREHSSDGRQGVGVLQGRH